MRKMLDIATWVGVDGMLHVLLSAVLTAMLSLVVPWWMSAVVVLAIGIAKEIVYDRWLGKGFATWKDIACDVVGIMIGLI